MAPIISKIHSTATREFAWQALTKLAHMKQWYFENIPAFEPEVGFKTQFPVSTTERTFTHLWEVVEVVPQSKIRYNWRYEEYPGNSFVSFEINDGENGVSITVTAEIVEDFPSDIPEFKRESGVAGWNFFMERLKIYLES